MRLPERLLCIALCVLSAGCATAPADQSGFLGSALDFRPAPDGSGASV